MDKTVRVVLLSGFLGSGKTTLLKRLLNKAEAEGMKAAVLMNEVGDVNLDGLEVDASVPMAELLGGCICCTIKADVGMELLQLANRHRPDIVFIESTGIAQPMEIIDAVSDVSMYAKLALTDVLTVVAADHLLDRVRIGSGRTYRLMMDQVRASSLVMLNKADLVREEELRELTDVLRDWNPHADIVSSIRCGIEADRLLAAFSEADERGLAARDFVASERETGPETGARPAPDRQNAERDAESRAFHSAHEHVQVLTHYLSGPLDSEAFERFLRSLPDNVYRAKGIVTFNDTASRFLFQYAYREADFMRITPRKTVQDVAVFIGEGFSRSDLSAKLERLLTEAAPESAPQ